MRLLIAYSNDCAEDAHHLVEAIRQQWASLPSRPKLQIIPFYEGVGALLLSELIDSSEFDLAVFLFWRRWEPAVAKLMSLFYGHCLQTGAPKILVYRCAAEVMVNGPSDVRAATFAEAQQLHQAFHDWFHNSDGTFRAAYNTYISGADLISRALPHVETLLQQREGEPQPKPDIGYELSNLFDPSRGFHFISYARSDFHRVTPFLQSLAHHKRNFWFDRALPGGEMWWEELAAKIKGSMSVIAFLTTTAQESRWIKKELTFADSLGRVIIPLQLESFPLSDGMHLLLSTHQILPPRIEELLVSLQHFEVRQKA
jgi:hypothetical protein